MKFRTLILCACAVALSACTKTYPDVPDTDAGVIPPVPHLHSHNDYTRTRPLLDALDARLDSVEADIYFQNADLQVSHDGVDIAGTLKGLYLEPLKARVQQNGGSVYGDGKPFFLWIDLKQGSTELQNELAAQLSAYDFLTQFTDDAVQEKAVTVVLTGDSGGKTALAARASPRPYIRDSNDYSPDDPPGDTRWGYYAVNYGFTIYWDGKGEIPPTQLRNFKNLVNGVHAKGRKIRFYSAPETDAYFKVARDIGVDFIGTDNPPALRAFIDSAQ